MPEEELKPYEKIRGGKTPATYDYHGRQITIKEAAELAGMTTEGIKYRLKKNGGSMEMAIDGRKSMAEAEKEIMTALGYGLTNSKPADSTSNPIPPDYEWPPDQNPLVGTAPACHIEDVHNIAIAKAATTDVKPEWKVRLKFINRAIAAMEQLEAVDLERTELANTIIDAAYELRGVRSELFEKYVDWEGLAK